LAILISVESKKIVHALNPATTWLHDQKFGFLIPITLLIIVSFPPLFGHEIIATLVGVTWSLPGAFTIVAIGTLLGEIATFCTIIPFALHAGLLAHVARNGGRWVLLVIRYSALPPHFATAVFASVGISFWTFLAAAILSLPRQMLPVYTGYALRPDVNGMIFSLVPSFQAEKLKAMQTTARATELSRSSWWWGQFTIVAYVWIQRKMKAATPDVIYARRKARQAKNDAPGPEYISMPNIMV
ncbi:hypothetical protein FB451DRAFT_1036475, partial [Mycena latifolia]